MARKARVEFEGALYHVLDRGDRREDIFHDDVDRERFLSTLAEVCERTGWRVHAFVLMSNHYHLMIETPQANLVAGMRWFQTTWTMRFNRRHRLSGHLFQGRYKAVVVDPDERRYCALLSDYIHLNPVRAGLIGLEHRLFDYRWSSYPWYAAMRGRSRWLDVGAVLGELGFEDTSAGRRGYAERMRRRAIEERQAGNKESEAAAELRRGWCLGGAGFRERMLRLLDAAGEKLLKPRRSRFDARVEHDHGLEESRRIMEIGLRCFGLKQEELGALKKGDARKSAIAAVIRQRTAVPNAWIANALELGHVSRVSHCVRAGKEGNLRRKLEVHLGA
jgi:putative transposase